MDDDKPAAAAPATEEVQGEALPPKRRHRATKAAKPKEQPQEQPQEPKESKPQADPLFFPLLLATQRQMQKEARDLKISNLRIC
jgi:hypothetical protein